MESYPEIDGVSAGSTNGLTFGANNLTVKGLVVNNFNSFTADGIGIAGNNNKIQGCYIGTEPDGMTAAPNELGISNEVSPSNGLLVGGTNPEDRYIISGNSQGGSSPNTGHINWTYQGNYIGVGKDGMTAVPNAQIGGSGAISIDNDDGHTVGGSAPGAINVISGNRSMGIAPHFTDNLLVEGNYFGVGYDGVTPVPNQSTGINISESANSTVRNNIIAHNGDIGINFNDNSTGLLLEGNEIRDNNDIGVNIANNSVG
jgi:titin